MNILADEPPRSSPRSGVPEGTPVSVRQASLRERRYAETPSARAFTMLEILLTVAIFAIGFAFVATIFPSAILLQKRAADDMLAQQVARNAEALLRGRVVDHATLEADMTSASPGYDTDQKIHPLPPGMLNGGSSPSWTLQDRGYPTAYGVGAQRRLVWVPVIQDSDGKPGTSSGDWRVFVFILQPRDNADYPATASGDANPDDSPASPVLVPPVRSVAATVDTSDSTRLNLTNSPTILRSGDLVLDNNGNVHKVVLAEPTYINVGGPVPGNPNPVTELWYAHPGTRGKSNPTVRILPLPNDPLKPLVQP